MKNCEKGRRFTDLVKINIRRSVSLALALILTAGCLLISVSADFSVTSVPGMTEVLPVAVYAYSDYEVTLSNAVYVSGFEDDGKILTDRKYSPANDEGSWVKIKCADGKNSFTATVTMDLGFTARSIYNFHLRAYKNISNNEDMPSKISFYISEDGKNFAHAGDASTLTDTAGSSATTAVYHLNTEKKLTARYVKAVFIGKAGTAICLNEIGVTAEGEVFRANGTDTLTDAQGVCYQISNGIASVIGFNESDSGNSGTALASNESFDTDGITYTLGKGTGNEVTVISDFIGDGRPNYSGTPNNVKYIVIHNTGTVEEDTDAERYNHRMHVMDGTSSWHYTVDDGVIYHSLADSIAGWHAGNAEYNYESIGIEMCVNGAPTDRNGDFVFSGSEYNSWVNSRFRKSIKNAAVLTAELLTRYGLDTDAVIQHSDASGKDCPMWLRSNGGELWNEFLKYVEEYYTMLNGISARPIINPQESIRIPEYISVQGGEVYPVTVIAANAFAEKTVLKSVHIGSAVEEIFLGCFDGTAIESISVSEENDNFYTENGILYSSGGRRIYNPKEDDNTPPSPKEDCELDIREIGGKYYLFLTEEDITLREIANQYGKSIKNAYSYNGILLSRSSVPTSGTTAVFSDGAKIYIIRRGDISGDGKINISDYILTKRICLNTYSGLSKIKPAALISNDGKTNISDCILIKRHILGTYEIK